jgi:SAM-dependent methyltransferase
MPATSPKPMPSPGASRRTRTDASSGPIGLRRPERSRRAADRPPTVERFNAWFFDRLDPIIDRKLRAEKRRLIVDVPDRVVEIGAGAGANLRYLPTGTRVTAIEPSTAMHGRLRRRARRYGIELEIEPSPAETLPVEDAAVELVISSLVLCTVADPLAAVAEIRRVLRPGGRLVFIEHVIARRRGLLRCVQRLVRRPWGAVFDGCDPCRDTERVLRAAGFSSVSLRRRRTFDPIFYPVVEQISGTATR